MSDKPSRAPMNKDICCISFKGLFAFLRQGFGEAGVDTVVKGLVNNDQYLLEEKFNPTKLIPVQKHHLVDPSLWISNELAQQLLANVKNVVSGPHPLFTAGEGSVMEGLSKTAFFMVKAFGTLFAIGRATNLHQRYNRTKTFSLIKWSKDTAVFEVKYLPGFFPTKDNCEFNRGVYSGIAKISGARDVTIHETECTLEGSDRCLFVFHGRKANIFRRLLRFLLSKTLSGLISEYEQTVLERDKLIEVLSQSEKRYRSLFESANDAIMLIHGDRFVDCNAKTLETLGCTREQVIGQSPRRFCPEMQPDGQPSWEKGWTLFKMALEGRPQAFPWQACRHDGRTFAAEITLNRVVLGGKFNILLIVRDVTARARAEEALRDSEQRLQLVADNLPALIAYVDTGLRYVFANQAYEEWLGIPTQQIVGRPVPEVLGPEIQRKLRGYQQQALAGQRVSAETVLSFPRKNDIHVNVQYIPHLDPHGRARGFFYMAQDITARKRTEEALQDSKQRLQLVADHLPALIAYVDRNLRYAFANLAYEKWFGRHPRQIVGHTVEEVAGREVLEKVRGYQQRVLSGENVCEEVFVDLPPHPKTHVDLQYIPDFDASGQVRGYIAMVQNITARKQAEEQIKAALAEKEVLLREIHHRAKNNMQVVSSLLTLQSLQIKDEQVLAALTDCQNRVQAMALAHETLYGSPTLASIDLEAYILRLGEALFQTYPAALGRVALQVEAKGLELGIDQATPLGLVINELISNSLKYAFPGKMSGAIILQAWTPEDGELELLVADDGVGLPPDFDWRNPKTLGLQIVTDLVEKQLGGSLSRLTGPGVRYNIKINTMSRPRT